MVKDEAAARAKLREAKRVVVKVGTRLLANRTGRPAPQRIGALVTGIADLMAEGREVVLVTSGAIGMGIDALGWKRRPVSLPDLQMAAAVGQARLVSYYAELFAKRRIKVGQVLLTHDVLNNRNRHINARNAINNLLSHRVLPIVNENDVVAVDEIKVGDNDSLAALTTLLVDAEVMVLLTTVNGLREPASANRTKRISYLPKITDNERGLAQGSNSAISVGGMKTKLESADWVASSGAMTVIADGRRADTLTAVFAGEDKGTLIAGKDGRARVRAGRKRWIAFFHRPKGTVVIDDGARRAIEEQGRSLLPVGVRSVEGEFEAGSVVRVVSLQGREIARGLVDFTSAEIALIAGLKSSEVSTVLGRKTIEEIIHRDNMVSVEKEREERQTVA